MGLHMDLQIPYYRMKGVQVNELMRLVHEFLRDRFSVEPSEPGAAPATVHNHLELFFTPSLLEA